MTERTITRDLPPRLGAMRQKVLEATQEISLIRALAITEASRLNTGLPRILQLALGFQQALRQLPAAIHDGERIVGTLTEKTKGAMLFPEMKSDFLIKEIDNFEEREFDRYVMTAEDKQLLREDINSFWSGKSGYDSLAPMLNEDTDFYSRNLATVIMNNFMGSNHLSYIDYKTVLDKGFEGIIQEAETAAAKISDTDTEATEKRDFYQAVILSAQAVIEHALKYSKLARQQAENTTDPERARELNEIADGAAQVPAKPARTFREAVQSFWFTVIALMHMDFPTELPYGRLDQLLYPYYQHDIEAEWITRGEALELIEELFIKVNGLCVLLEYAGTKVYDGNNLRQTVTIGGLSATGESAVNDLSYLILDATDKLRLIYPNIAVRMHPGLPDAFWKRVVMSMTNGSNLLEVFNDEVIIQGFMQHGFPAAASYDYLIGGCVQPVPGSTYGPNCSAYINGPKILEMVLNGGMPFYSMSGDDEDLPAPVFNTFDEFWGAFSAKLKAVIKSAVDGLDVVDRIQKEQLPDPILSALIDGTLESGKDAKAGGARHNYTGISFVGIGTVTDSIAAIKELVFEKNAYTLAEMIEWLKSDFEGYEPQRQLLRHRVAKYGNDIHWVDSIARDIAALFTDALSAYRTNRGGTYGCGLHSENHHIIEGIVVAATPDGRRTGEKFSTGSGPTSGLDQSGPTATLRSIAAIDYTKIITGSSVNLRFNPSLLKTQDQRNQFEALLKGYFKLGGQHLQINVVNTETLRDAQRNPDQYQDLIVRVVGYSARFVDLTLPLQEEIIRRTEMDAC